MKIHSLNSIITGMLLLSQAAYCAVPSQVQMDVSAEAIARVALYYKGVPVSDQQIDYPLEVNSASSKFEKISSDFYLVGNVSQAEISFSNQAFSLTHNTDNRFEIGLNGTFIFNGNETDARQTLNVPVLNDISEGTSTNGFKVHFVSELTTGNYKAGTYSNTYTLIITPVV